MEHAFIFLPDISGFTSFVTRTEQVHSRHLITELLEAVIAENALHLEVQELEGDAVFFVRRGNPPTVAELAAQARRMFLTFHTHLRIIERDSICQCGACRTVSNLTLKFIAHAGKVDRTLIAGKSSLLGSDVILAHRMLKTGIPGREYLLVSGSYPGLFDRNGVPTWLKWQQHEEDFEHFGTVPLLYAPLAELRQEIPDERSLPDPTPRGRARTLTIPVQAPLHLVHALLIDLDFKREYIPGLRESVSEHPINRVQAKHTCVFDDFEVHFVTLHNAVEGKEIVYRESAEVSAGFGFVTDYRLREQGGMTLMDVRVFPTSETDEASAGGSAARVIRRIARRVKFRLALFGAQRNLRSFAAFCEEFARSPRAAEYGVPVHGSPAAAPRTAATAI